MTRPRIRPWRRDVQPYVFAGRLARPVACTFGVNWQSRRGATKTLGVVLMAGVVAVGSLVGYRLSQPIPSTTPAETEPYTDQAPRVSVGSSAPDVNSRAPDDASRAPDGREAAVPDQPPVPTVPSASAQETIDRAVAVLNHVTARYPQNPDAHEVLARFRYWAGESATAVEAWQRCLDLNPAYAHAYSGLASVAAKRGDYEEAAALYEKAVSLHTDSPSDRLEWAKALLSTGQTSRAIEVLRELVDAFPGQTDAYYQLGIAYQEQKEFQEAKRNFEEALAMQPRYAAAQIGLANTSLRLGQHDEAKRHRERFEQLRADEVQRSRESRQRFDDLQATREQVARTYVEAGRVYLAEKNLSAAERLWHQASRLDPSNVDCRQALAWLHLQQGEVPQTIAVLQELAQLEPKNLGYQLEIARLHAESGRTAEAEKVLRDIQRTAPQNAAGHAALAKLYLQTGQRPAEALSLSQKAAELAPTAEHYVLLSSAYEQNRRWSESADAMGVAAKRAPQNAGLRARYEMLKQRAAQAPTEAD